MATNKRQAASAAQQSVNEGNVEAADAMNIEPNIIATIKNEHKYTLMLISVIKEQLANYDVGKTPDYPLLMDTMDYLTSFPEKFNHPAKEKLIKKIISLDPVNNVELENLLAEKKQTRNAAKEVIAALKGLLKEETILKEEQLKIFAKDYVEIIETHIKLESQILLTKARSMLSDEELKTLSRGIHQTDNHDLTKLVEEGYKELSDALNKRWGEIEEAANDLALAEFVGMGAFFEAIEPLSLNMMEMSKIIKELSYKLYIDSYECYRSLLTEKQENGKDYLEKPVANARQGYADYVSSIHKMRKVWTKTKEEVSEPYEARKEFLQPVQGKKPGKKKSSAI